MTDVQAILSSYRTWAVVGCSPDPYRDSHGVASFLQRRGCRIVPVNPTAAGSEIHGERVYATLEEAAAEAGPIEVVDIFRRSEDAGTHVDEAIAIGAKAVWMQLGVVDEDAAQRARDAGLAVVMDRCPKIEWR
jgi:hypothetical protein